MPPPTNPSTASSSSTNTSTSTDSSNAGANDISAAEGTLISKEAATWIGTPYALMGENSTKGAKGKADCSGSTSRIYLAAGFEYAHREAKMFPEYALKSGLFRELGPGEVKQDGDILSWRGHMAIYSTFTSKDESQYKTTQRVNKQNQPWTQYNDMWTASHPNPDSLPYRPSAIQWSGQKEPPRVFRRQKSTTP